MPGWVGGSAQEFMTGLSTGLRFGSHWSHYSLPEMYMIQSLPMNLLTNPQTSVDSPVPTLIPTLPTLFDPVKMQILHKPSSNTHPDHLRSCSHEIISTPAPTPGPGFPFECVEADESQLPCAQQLHLTLPLKPFDAAETRSFESSGVSRRLMRTA